MKRTERRSPWLLAWHERPLRTRKMRTTEERTRKAKEAGDWWLASKLKRLLRKAWWGYKRIKNRKK
jgi:hypothetical protein